MAEDPAQLLSAAFDDFLEELRAARNAIDQSEWTPPDPTPRNLADGYVYLLGHATRLFETVFHQSPEHPRFQRAMNGMFGKYTIDNADTAYLIAAIDPDSYYVMEAELGDAAGPRFFSAAAISAMIGDTGDLAELGDGTNVTIDSVTSFDVGVGDTGDMKMLIGPEPDPTWPGPFIATKTRVDLNGEQHQRVAPFLAVRQVFSDWVVESPYRLHLTRRTEVGAGARGQDRQPEVVAGQLRELGVLVRNQMRFWNALNPVLAETQPTNAVRQPAPPFIAGGTAGVAQLFGGGLYNLAPGQAVVLEIALVADPHYFGITLGNLWSESFDQGRSTSSRSRDQMHRSPDGRFYVVVTDEDPGGQNWLDTTGAPVGNLTSRFIFSHEVADDERPTITAVVCDRADVAWQIEQLGGDFPEFTTEDRLAERAARQRHLDRRYPA